MHTEICNNVVMDKGEQGNALIGIYDLFIAKQFSHNLFWNILSNFFLLCVSQFMRYISRFLFHGSFYLYLSPPAICSIKGKLPSICKKRCMVYYQLSLILYVFVIFSALYM